MAITLSGGWATQNPGKMIHAQACGAFACLNAPISVGCGDAIDQPGVSYRRDHHVDTDKLPLRYKSHCLSVMQRVTFGTSVLGATRDRTRHGRCVRAPMDGLWWSTFSRHSQGAFRPSALRGAQGLLGRWRCVTDGGCTSPRTVRCPPPLPAATGIWNTATHL